MHISPGDIRNAITNATYKIPKERAPAPSADSVLCKAIRLYHAQGVEVATHYIESALKKEFWRSGRGSTIAKYARQNLDVYIDLAAADRRVAATVGAKHPVRAGNLTIAADVDVVLHADARYVGRMAIAANQVRPFTPGERALIAAAPFRGLVEEFEGGLFGGTVEAIEIWELRLAVTSIVPRQEAEAAWPALVQHLRRAASL